MPIKICISKVSDGSMKPLDINNQLSVLDARAKFLQKNNINPINTTLVKIDYNTNNFRKYIITDNTNKGDGIIRESGAIADAIVTISKGHALLLPLADCVGAVIYDEISGALMLSHLGRHSLEQFGGTESVNFLVKKFNVKPENLKVWLSPSAGKDSYPLKAFSSDSLQEIAVKQLIQSGVSIDNITTSKIDTTKNDQYFSHSQFIAGNRKTDGRFALVAMIE